MLSRTIVLGAMAVAVVGAPAVAAAEPNEPPPPPNVNGWVPVKPSDYSVLGDTAYAFTTPDGLSCMIQRNGGYGCFGALPGAPEGANLVSGGIAQAPGFADAGGNPFAV